MEHGITIVVSGPEHKEDPGVAPGMQHFRLDPPQPLKLKPITDVSRAPVEGQSSRFIVEGRFTKATPDELVFEVESVCSQDWDPEVAFREIAETGEEY